MTCVPFFGQVIFPVANVFETLFPNIFVVFHRVRQLLALQNSGMYADDEHLFVMRAVKYADATPRWQHFLRAPEVIVVELLGGRSLKCCDLAASAD